DGSPNGPSLLRVVDKTVTAMGSRMLKNILVTPLADVRAIQRRLDWVEFFYQRYMVRTKLRNILRDIYDLERILTKVSYKTVNARDLLAMAASLRAVPQIAQLVAGLDWEAVATLTDYDALCSLLERAINPDPPATIREGNIIREGYSPELDELRVLAASASTW